MTLRPSELAQVAGELAEALVGRPVQKVVQPDARTLLLGFPHAWLLVSVDPRRGRVHLLEEKPAGTGDAAPAFCMLARKELVGARLVEVEAVAGERAFALRFARSDGQRVLLGFLYGAGGRLLLRGVEGRVLGVLGSKTGPEELPPPRVDDRPSRFPGEPPSTAIARHYDEAIRADQIAAARAAALGPAKREVDRLRRLEVQLEGDLARTAVAEDHRRHADLLLAHLAEVPRGASQVTLPDDFHDGEPLAIALDPSLSAKDNAARLYREHQRRHRGRARVEKRLAETRSERANAERRLQAIEQTPPDEFPLSSVRAPSGKTGKALRRNANAPRPPYRVYRSQSGMEILVGKGAAKNDELTFKVARGDDLWLHTRDVPGAHVVVPCPSKRTVDEATLLDAATLAMHHSPARDEGQADVTYAPRKLVRKPRGVSPGQVSVAGGKTLRLRMEPERLQRLLASLEES